MTTRSKKAEQYEVLKQTLLHLLDDPQVQQKIVTLLIHRLGKDLRIRVSQIGLHNCASNINSAC
jgi:hypothetical protein